MTELEEKIKNYANNYYQGNELISDAEYDALIEQLKKENPNSEILKGVVGTDLKGISKKYKLPITMGTLEKCNSDEEMKNWLNKHPHDNMIASLKIDGNGIVLTYKDGILEKAYSRGDGEFGQDYTDKVLRIANIPTTIKDSFSGHIRGEAYMSKSVWENNFKNQKNPRNTAAGILGKKDTENCKYLDFIAYDVFDDDNFIDKTKKEKFDFLERNGFDIPVYIENPTFEQLVEWKNKLNINGEIPCDGIVYSQNITNKTDLARHTPLNEVAFKPNLEVVITKLMDISWEMKGRYLSPVAILSPVEISGAMVSRASLANINIMKELGLKIGDEVFVERRGLIIPKIIGIVK